VLRARGGKMLLIKDYETFFDLLKKSDASELFALLQYASNELNSKNEMAIIKVRELYKKQP
jgi:hypothetical protein